MPIPFTHSLSPPDTLHAQLTVASDAIAGNPALEDAADITLLRLVAKKRLTDYYNSTEDSCDDTTLRILQRLSALGNNNTNPS